MTTTMNEHLKLPESQKDTQHPLSDMWFSHAKAIMEACAIDNGGCEECENKDECVNHFDALADRCYDSPLTARHLIEFVVKHSELVLGEKILLRKANTNKISTKGFSTLVNGTMVYTCLHCNYSWISRLNKKPPLCPSCHANYWYRPPKWRQKK